MLSFFSMYILLIPLFEQDCREFDGVIKSVLFLLLSILIFYLTNLLSFNVIDNNIQSPLSSECNMSLSIERLKDLAQLLLLFIYKCFCNCNDSVKLSSFLSFSFSLSSLLLVVHIHIQWIMMMTLMWSRCIHTVPWNKRKKGRDSEWLKRNKWKRKKKRNENDKIEIKRKQRKEGRKEWAERSVLSLHQCSSFTRPWPILVHSKLSFCRNSMPTLLFAH